MTTEDLILYINLVPHFRDIIPTVEIKLNEQVIPTPNLIRDQESKIAYNTTLNINELSNLTIELKDKTPESNITDQKGNIIVSHGIIISSIAIGWPLSARDKLFVEWMSDNKGSEDNTNRIDPEFQRQAEAKKQIASSSNYTRFTLNDNMVKESCTFTNHAEKIKITPQSNRIFKITQNGTFTFTFKPPFAYWALQNFI